MLRLSSSWNELALAPGLLIIESNVPVSEDVTRQDLEKSLRCQHYSQGRLAELSVVLKF